MHSPARESRASTPAAARLLEVQAQLQALQAQRLPRLRVVAERMREQTLRWDWTPLAEALRALQQSVAALQFELLVPVGLRAGALPRATVAFRDQVAAVAGAAGRNWAEVQEFLQACAARDAPESHTQFEFSRALRGIEHQVSELAQRIEGAAAELRQDQEAATAAVSRQGYEALGHKAADLTRQVAGLQALCGAGRNARELATSLSDEREALCVVLRRQAQGLGPPLLKALGRLIAPGLRDPPDKLLQAQAAAEELGTSIDGALAQIEALQGYGQQLETSLEVLAHLGRARVG